MTFDSDRHVPELITERSLAPYLHPNTSWADCRAPCRTRSACYRVRTVLFIAELASVASFPSQLTVSMASLRPPPSSSHNNKRPAVSFTANPPHRAAKFPQNQPIPVLLTFRTAMHTSCVVSGLLVEIIRPPSMESTRWSSSLGFVLFFFFLTGSWKARDCPTTWYAAGPIRSGARVR